MAYWADVSAQTSRKQRQAQYVATIAGGYGDWGATDPDPSLYANQARLMQQLSWVYSAVSLVAKTTASLANFQVMGVTGEDKKQIVNHEFEQLLRTPNPYQFDSQFEFVEAMTGFLTLSGNCYMFLNALSPKLPPAEMYLLRPDRVMVVPDKTKFIKGYLFEVDGIRIPFDRDEVVHLKNFHPLNDWYGLSAIEAISLAAESDFKQQVWNRNFFDKQHAKPQGALAYADNINDTDWDRQKNEMKEEHGGTQRRVLMLRGVGKGGVQWLQMGISQKDMEFLQGRQFNKEEIYQALAPGLLSILDKNTTEANSTAGEKTLREYCIFPILKRVQEKWTAKILPRYGEGLIGEFEEIRPRDRTLDLSERQAYERVHTIKEIRAKFDGDDPLGDERDDLFPSQIGQGAAPSVPVSDPSLQPNMQPNGNFSQDPNPKQGDAAATDANNADQAGDNAGKQANEEAKAANTTGVMIALDIPPFESKILEAGARDAFGKDATLVPAQQMHVTLAYFGDVADVKVSRETLTALVRAFAARQSAIHGGISGIGKFAPVEADGQSAFYASFDSPELPAFYNELAELLEAAGVPADKSHGFIPHITVAYSKSNALPDFLGRSMIGVWINAVTLAWGGEWVSIPMGETGIGETPQVAGDGVEGKAFLAELGKWEAKALRRLREGKPVEDALEFKSEAIAPTLASSIRGALEVAPDAGAVKRIFAGARDWRGYP